MGRSPWERDGDTLSLSLSPCPSLSLSFLQQLTERERSHGRYLNYEILVTFKTDCLFCGNSYNMLIIVLVNPVFWDWYRQIATMDETLRVLSDLIDWAIQKLKSRGGIFLLLKFLQISAIGSKRSDWKDCIVYRIDLTETIFSVRSFWSDLAGRFLYYSKKLIHLLNTRSFCLSHHFQVTWKWYIILISTI